MNRWLGNLVRGTFLGVLAASSAACVDQDVAIAVHVNDLGTGVDHGIGVDLGPDAAYCGVPPDIGIPELGCLSAFDAHP